MARAWRSTQPFVDERNLESRNGGRICPQRCAEMTMKRFGLTVLSCVLLSGCIFDPTFDTSNWEAYQKSLAAIKAKLSNDDVRRLDIALKYLVLETAARFDGSFSNVMAGKTPQKPFPFR